MHIKGWPSGTPPTLTFHYVINQTAGKQITATVPASGDVKFGSAIRNVRPEVRVYAQLVIDAPFKLKSKTYSGIMNCTTPSTCVIQDVKVQ